MCVCVFAAQNRLLRNHYAYTIHDHLPECSIVSEQIIVTQINMVNLFDVYIMKSYWNHQIDFFFEPRMYETDLTKTDTDFPWVFSAHTHAHYAVVNQMLLLLLFFFFFFFSILEILIMTKKKITQFHEWHFSHTFIKRPTLATTPTLWCSNFIYLCLLFVFYLFFSVVSSECPLYVFIRLCFSISFDAVRDFNGKTFCACMRYRILVITNKPTNKHACMHACM